jgi:hypothetical protein
MRVAEVIVRVSECGGPVTPDNTVVIGDTPLIGVALAGGARSVAVDR